MTTFDWILGAIIFFFLAASVALVLAANRIGARNKLPGDDDYDRF